MGHPVYRFGAVLRRLRNDAGLTVLAAAEAAGYSKYERWESGQTQVGGQYLTTIADAFGVADDMHLLVYAWLLDRLTPDAGEPSRTLNLDELRRTSATRPRHASTSASTRTSCSRAAGTSTSRSSSWPPGTATSASSSCPRCTGSHSRGRRTSSRSSRSGSPSTQEVTTFDSAPVGLLLRQLPPVRDLPVVPFDAAI